MSLDVTVLNAECAAATAMFDTVTLHTADPGNDGANDDETAGSKSLTWSTPSSGTSTATASWTGITGDWKYIGFWNSTTFVGSIERDISFATSADLSLTFQHKVTQDEG
jgi:hypothetical protein